MTGKLNIGDIISTKHDASCRVVSLPDQYGNFIALDQHRHACKIGLEMITTRIPVQCPPDDHEADGCHCDNCTQTGVYLDNKNRCGDCAVLESINGQVPSDVWFTDLNDYRQFVREYWLFD